MSTSSSDTVRHSGSEPTLDIVVIPVTAFQQNASLLICKATRKAALVDPGGEAEKLISAVDGANVTLEQVLLTHGHIDHVGGAADVAAHFGVPIVGPERSDAPLIEGIASQATMFGMPDVKVPSIDRWLEGGDTISVGELSFDVLYTPGHAPGHVIFVNHAHRFIVMGDVLFAGSVGRTDLPGSDHATLMRSIFQTVLPLGDEYQFLPGHGQASTLGHERQTNPFLAEGFTP
ncbi:MAG: MBL fold metallo-hydrolase [Pseudomonadota bacterium]